MPQLLVCSRHGLPDACHSLSHIRCAHELLPCIYRHNAGLLVCAHHAEATWVHLLDAGASGVQIAGNASGPAAWPAARCHHELEGMDGPDPLGRGTPAAVSARPGSGCSCTAASGQLAHKATLVLSLICSCMHVTLTELPAFV